MLCAVVVYFACGVVVEVVGAGALSVELDIALGAWSLTEVEHEDESGAFFVNALHVFLIWHDILALVPLWLLCVLEDGAWESEAWESEAPP